MSLLCPLSLYTSQGGAMFHGRSTGCLLLLSLAATLAPPSRAQQSGVLIGIAKDLMPPDQFHPVQIQLGIRYSTVLILHEGLKASVRATLPDIVVPRKDNFWRVGVRTDCQIESEPDERREGGAVKKQENWVEQLYISPIGQAPQVPTAFYDPQTPCPAQLMADFKKGQDSRQTKEKAQYTDQGRFGPCMYSMIAIMSVTPSFVSTRYHGGNFGCETHGFSWTDRASVSRLDDGAPVQYSHLLGDDGWQEYNRVLIESGKDLESSGL